MIANRLRPRLGGSDMRVGEKLWHVSWSFVLLIALVCAVGFATLYSAANGSLEPWAGRQMFRFAVGLAVMLGGRRGRYPRLDALGLCALCDGAGPARSRSRCTAPSAWARSAGSISASSSCSPPRS